MDREVAQRAREVGDICANATGSLVRFAEATPPTP
jgi:hypothetical protein